jgi:tetratricopeptide (TPR) repeat protein
LFVGRERELAQLERGLARVPVAVICGLAGVGKSSLAYAVAATWSGPVAHVAARGPELGALLDEVRRAVGPAPEVLGDDARAAALAEALDGAGALAVVDDLHLLAADDQARLLAAVGARLDRGRLVATSRERPASAQGYDRVEIHLGGLSERAARTLWASLDELRGATAGFARAFAASGGNPFLLRRSHAGDPSAPDPLVAAIAMLPGDAGALLGAIALAGAPLGAAELTAIGGRDPKVALGVLRRALLVDLDGDGAPLLHELVRTAARAALAPGDLADLHARLAAALAPRRDPAAIVATVHHHLAAAAPERARAHLVTTGKVLLDVGASRAVATLTAELGAPRDRELGALRARALARLLDVGEGEKALRAALAARPPSGAELSALGTLALCAGRFEDARLALARAATDPEATPSVRAAIAGLDAVRRFHTESLGAAMGDLAAAAESARGGGRAVLAATATYLAWLERYAVGAERSGLPTTDNRAPSAHGYRAAALGALALGGYDIRAAPGDSARALAALEVALAAHDDPLARIHTDAVRALRQWEDGDRLGAAAALGELANRAEDAGYALAVLWVQIFAARIAFVLGQRRAARALLERVGERARSLGAHALVRAAGYCSDDDPVARLAVVMHSAAATSSSSVRTRAFQAVAAAARGEAVAIEPDRRDGYHVEAALAHLAVGMVARRGRRGEVAWERACAAAAAALADRADPDLLPALLGVLDGDPRGTTAPVVVDAVRHEVIAGAHTLALGKRPVMRKLLYALAARPGEVLAKDELTQAAWARPYDPLRHDNPLFVNLSRLRGLLKPTGISVEADPDQGGYRLVSADPILVRRGR